MVPLGFLGTDRIGWLIPEAAVRGIIDFSKARFFDPAWQRHAQSLLLGLQRLNKKEQADIRHRHYCAVMQMAKLSEESAGETEQAATVELHRYEDAFLPNAKEVRKQAEEGVAKGRVSRWEDRYGKMNDPETQERIRQTAEALRALREKTAAEDERGSIEGLMGMSRRQRRNVNAGK